MTTFKTDEKGLVGFTKPFANKISLHVNFRTNLIKLYYGEIIKEEFEVTSFTVEAFTNYIFNLSQQYGEIE